MSASFSLEAVTKMAAEIEAERNAMRDALRGVQPMLRAMSMLVELDEKDCAAIRVVETLLAERKEWARDDRHG